MFWKPELRISAAMNSALFPYVLQGLVLLKGPLLLACALTLLPGKPSAYSKYSYHFAIAMGVAIYLLIKGSGSLYAQDFLLSPHQFVWVLSLNEWHLIKIMPLLYALLALHHLHRVSKSSDSHERALQPLSAWSQHGWIYLLILGMTLNWGWSFFAHIMGNMINVTMSDQLGIIDNYVSLMLLGALLTYRLIVVENITPTPVRFELEPEPIACFTSETPIKPLPVAPEKLITAMRDDKLFLDARLNVERLAEHLSCSPRDISITINQHFDTHFFDFLNHFRIEEAKRLLADPTHAQLTITDIFKRSGFNSKSAFHRAFGKSVGITPSDFRRNALTPTLSDQQCAHP